MKWYYIDGPNRLGPFSEEEWQGLLDNGTIRPETLVWHDDMDAQWRPYGELFPPEMPPQEQEAPEVFAQRVAGEDYTVPPIGNCLADAFNLLFSQLGLVVGAGVLMAVLVMTGSLMPYVGWLIQLFISAPLMAGLWLIYLRLIRGKPTGINDLFEGFQGPRFGQLVLLTLVQTVIVYLFFIPAVVTFFPLGIEPKMLGEHLVRWNFTQAELIWLLIVLTGALFAIYFTICWIFSIPLVIDKGLGFWAAMRLSRQKVLQHPWRICWLLLAASVVAGLGFLMLIVGAIFTMPIYYLALGFLYEEMFGKDE